MQANTAQRTDTATIALCPQTDIKAAPGSLLDALHRRHTSRIFADRPLSLRHISQVLWSAYGMNRHDGKRTVPAPMGIYALKIYVILPQGIYHYRPQTDCLTLLTRCDFRQCDGEPDFARQASVNIAIYADYDAYGTGDPDVDRILSGHEARMAMLNAGAAAENVYLYCASEDINVVERILFNDKAFRTAASLPQSYRFMVALTLGYGE